MVSRVLVCFIYIPPYVHFKNCLLSNLCLGKDQTYLLCCESQIDVFSHLYVAVGKLGVA